MNLIIVFIFPTQSELFIHFLAEIAIWWMCLIWGFCPRYGRKCLLFLCFPFLIPRYSVFSKSSGCKSFREERVGGKQLTSPPWMPVLLPSYKQWQRTISSMIHSLIFKVNFVIFHGCLVDHLGSWKCCLLYFICNDYAMWWFCIFYFNQPIYRKCIHVTVRMFCQMKSFKLWSKTENVLFFNRKWFWDNGTYIEIFPCRKQWW